MMLATLVLLLFLFCQSFIGISSSNVSLGLLQIPIDLSLNSIETYIQKASTSKVDIIIFPSEYFNSTQCWSSNQIIINQTITWTIQYNLAILITCNNTNNYQSNAILIDQTGKIVLNYTKIIHENNENDPNINITTLKTSYSNTDIILSILMDDDIYYPELGRDLLLQSVDLILLPTSGELTINDDIVLYTRAYENVYVIARVNRASKIDTNDNGRSAIGSTYINSETEDGLFILPPVNNEEQLILASFDLNEIKQVRTNSIFGDAFRRPFRYQQLCGIHPFNTTFIKPINDDIIVTVAALQMVSGQSVEDNIQIADKFIRQASIMGADIVLMPEMWSIGYAQFYPGYKYQNMSSLNGLYKWLSLSSNKNSNFYNYFKSLSNNLSIAIGMSYMENIGIDNMLPPKNSITLFDKNGNELYTYSKVHTVNSAQDEALTTPGHQWYMAPLDLGDSRGKINVGSMICYDQEFPESARVLSQLGVELILKPNACYFDLGSHWRLRSKSIENTIGIIMSNYGYPSICYPNGAKCNGNSCAYDYNGNILNQANITEQIMITKFNINEIRKARINNINRIKSHKIIRLCDFQRLNSFTQHDGYSRVSGSTI